MKTSWFKKYSLDWPTPFYVLLLAAFPVLYLYSYNISEIDAGQLGFPLSVYLAGAFLLWALLTLLLRDGRKAGLATALFILLFSSYGRLYEYLTSLGVFVPGHAYLLPGVLFIWGYCVYFISRAKRDFRTSTTVLNIIAAVLIVLNLANILIYEITKPQFDAGVPLNATDNVTSVTGETQSLPDIYFIILDEYANHDALKEWCGYDNSWFLKSLEDKGFYIASKSTTRSYDTPQAMASVLNMEYLAGNGDPSWSDTTYQKLAHSKAADFLKSKGYKFVYFGCWTGLESFDKYMEKYADLYFNHYESGNNRVNEFEQILWKTTMLSPVYYKLTGSQYDIVMRRGVLDTLEHLKEIPDIAGPKFVFAHILPPHEPFVFGPKGETVAPINYHNFKDRQFYLGQCIFISGEIDKVVGELVAKSKQPPLIIIQSDHGLRPGHPGMDIDIDVNGWHRILNAMYLPGMDKAVLYDSISSVNTFRLIFNQYFNADYDLLPDD